MRLFLPTLILALSWTGMAEAAARAIPKGQFAIPQTRSLRDAGLRGAITATPPLAVSPTLAQAGIGQSRLAQSVIQPFNSGMTQAGLGALGLAAVGDTAPQCRVQCTNNRLICGDDLACDSGWAQCVSACSTPAPR